VGTNALIFIVLIFALMWLLFIRPQRRKQQAQKDMLENVGPGDEIVTAGGLYGTVRGVEDDALRLEVAPGLEVRIARRAVAAVIPPEEEEEAEDEDLDEDEVEDAEDGAEEHAEAVESAVANEVDEEPAEAVTQGDSVSETRR
jgi:preprotein translocase subunit YajC